MKTFFGIALFLFCSFTIASGQTPSPTPVEEEADVVKITTNLIQLDVTVTDPKGRVVTDLRPEEIEVFENGKRQAITNFSFVNVRTGTIESAGPVPGVPGRTQPAAVAPPPAKVNVRDVRRTIALVIDDLTLSYESISSVRNALKKFVDEQMQPSDMAAIVRTGRGIGSLQQFTSDKRMLYAAIERINWNPIGTDGGAFAPLRGDLAGSLGVSDKIRDDSGPREARNDFFSVGTLGSVDYILRGMSEMPGRKSILLFSEGFSLTSRDGTQNTAVVEAIKRLTEQANRASVVIYAIDVRGLKTVPPLTAADDTKGMSLRVGIAIVENRSDALTENQEGLSFLAESTGGIALKNNNDLDIGVGKILEDQTGYYLIGYEPDEKTFSSEKSRFNKFTVKVARPGLKARYRNGFFAVADAEKKSAVKTPREQIVNALYSPFGTGDITVKLTPLFANDTKHGSYINTLIHVRGSDLKFIDEADGWKKVTFDIVAVALGDNGQVVDQLKRTETLRANGDFYDGIIKSGFVYSVPFPIKKPGGYQLRIVLHDRETAKIGSANQFVEIPDLTRSRLLLSDILFREIKPESKSPDKQNESPAEFKSGTATFYFVNDTAARTFKPGAVLSYNLMILNARIDKASGKPRLKTQVKVFHEGKEVFSGAEKDLLTGAGADMLRLPFGGSMQLGADMVPGEYILQVIVTDTLGKESKVTSQWMDFEIVK